jgi:hypothetical protein
VLRGQRGKPSCADGWDPMKREYAMTASEGGGGVDILCKLFRRRFYGTDLVRLGTSPRYETEMCPTSVRTADYKAAEEVRRASQRKRRGSRV